MISFPMRGITGLAAEFAHLHAKELEGASESFYLAYLTFLGAAVSRHVRLDTSLPVQPRLYTILLGESATAKKSSAIDFTARFFESLQLPYLKTIHGLGSAEGVARVLSETGLPLVICLDELKIFVDKTKQEGNVGLPMINSLFENNKWDNYLSKQKSAVVLREAYVSLLAASTIATYDSMWTSNCLDIGFINRLFLVTCRRTRRVAMPKDFDRSVLRRIARETERQIKAITDGDVPVRFKVTRAARAVWDEWYETLEDTIHARRLDTIGMRLMLLLAVTTGERNITRDIVDRVVAILDYELSVRRETDPVDAVNIIAKLEEKIRRCLGEHPGLKYRQLSRKIHATRYGTYMFKTALNNLAQDGQVVQNQETMRLFLSPEAHDS